MDTRVGLFWQIFDTDTGRYKQHKLYIHLPVLELNEEQMTEDEQLYAQFYSNPDVLSKCSTMSIEELLVWEEDLRKIVLEAKATQSRVSTTRKERVSKLTKEERDKLITNPDGTVSDAINAVKIRRDRMSKADKLAALLKDMGIESSGDIMKNIKADETKQAIHNNNGGIPTPTPEKVEELKAQPVNPAINQAVKSEGLSFLDDMFK